MCISQNVVFPILKEIKKIENFNFLFVNNFVKPREIEKIVLMRNNNFYFKIVLEILFRSAWTERELQEKGKLIERNLGFELLKVFKKNIFRIFLQEIDKMV